MKHISYISALLIFAALQPARAEDLTKRCEDRAAIERVYHGHRLGTKQPFELAMPRVLLEQVVRQDQHKEVVLKKVYGVEITPAMVAAEVERINTTTRAPEVLSEIKKALGDDAARFAAAMARPIIVERELRHRFDNDDKLPAAQRRVAEQARETLLGEKPVANMRDVALLKLALAPPAEPTETSDRLPQGFAEPVRVLYFGDYELVEEIALGGMGVVYRATQVSLNRIVVRKVIPAGNFSSPAMVERFQTEAEAAGRLEHPTSGMQVP